MNTQTINPASILKGSSINADTTHKDKALRQACADFEAYILQQILTLARQSEPDGLFDQSFAGDMFKSMQDEERAKQMAHSGGAGLGEVLYQQLSGKAKQTIR
jgi:flagellar protein FlgJ